MYKAKYREALERTDNRPSILYVGAVVPDEETYRNRAFSRAGNRYQTNMIATLTRTAHDVKVVSQQPAAAFPRSKNLVIRGGRAGDIGGAPAIFVPMLNLPVLRQTFVGGMVVILTVLWAATRWRVPRMIWTYNLSEPPGLFTLLAARLTRSIFVANVTDINVPGVTVSDSLTRRLDFRLHQLLLPRVDGLVTITDAIGRDFAPSVKGLTIDGGLTTREFFNADCTASSSGSKKGTWRVGMAGSLTEANGVRIVLEALDLLSESDYTFHLAGDGPLVPEVSSVARDRQNLIYEGYLSYEEVLELYGKLDILLNVRLSRSLRTPYLFPSKVIECMATGLPVITTAVGHAIEEYDPYVWTLQQENGPELARLIQQVSSLEPVDRYEFCRAAREYIRENKLWHVHQQRLLSFISSL